MMHTFIRAQSCVRVLSRIASAALLMAASIGSWAHSDSSTSSYNAVPVVPGVVMLQGEGGNVGVVDGADGLLIIDNGYEKNTEVLMHALHDVAEHDKPTFILNTHWHSDHTGSNRVLGEHGGLIVAHDNVRKRLASGGEVKAFNMVVPPADSEALPVMTYSETMTLHHNGFELLLDYSSPAHTDGDSVVYFYKDSNLVTVHMGDLFFNGFYPFIDASSGGSSHGMLAGVKNVLSQVGDNTPIIPGHGPLATKADLQRYFDFLQAAIGRIEALKNKGKSLPEVVAAEPLTDFEETWGDGFLDTKTWIGIVYKTL